MSVCKTQHTEKLQTCLLPKKCAERAGAIPYKNQRRKTYKVLKSLDKVTTAGKEPQNTGKEQGGGAGFYTAANRGRAGV